MISAHFSRSEFACRCGCGFDTVDAELLAILEAVRQHFDAPVKVSSACRCSVRNESVGGGAKSQHLLGRAADIQVKDVPPPQVADYIESLWPDEHGLGRYNSFTHVDSRKGKARW